MPTSTAKSASTTSSPVCVYDDNSRLIATVDDNDNTTEIRYDALNRPVEKINADTTRHTVTYDRDSNVTRAVDPAGNRVDSTFDALNRLVRRDVTAVAGVEGTVVETFFYDGLSRPTRATDDNGADAPTHVVTRVYDSLSRVLEETQDSDTCSAIWSGDDRRLSVTYPGGRTLDTDFDAIDRPLAVRDTTTPVSGGVAPVFQCHWMGPAGGRVLKRIHANGTYLSFLDDAENTDIGYDQFKRVDRLRHILDRASLVDRGYAYNRADYRTEETRIDDAALKGVYTYDSVYRVVQANFDTEGTVGATLRDLRQTAYAYDGVGNRREATVDTDSDGVSVEPYVVNEMNEYTVVDGTPRVHDDDGNLTLDGDFRHVFDYRDRLIRVHRASDAALVARYEYDALSQRVSKTVFDPDAPGAPTGETRYLYDGWRVVEEQNSLGDVQVTYVYGVGLDEPVEMLKTPSAPGGAGRFFLHPNALGDVVAVTDVSGAVVERFRYDEFGRADRASTTGVPYLFQSRRLDPETGLHYFRHRYYDSGTGRFMQRDLVHDPVNVGNQYTFVGNGPVSRSDGLGQKTETWGEWYA